MRCRGRNAARWILVAGMLAAGGCPGPVRTTAALRPELARTLFRAINGERRRAGLRALEWREDLARIARRHTMDMARHDALRHRGTEGGLVEERLRQERIDWQEVGENVARNKGYDDPVAEAVRGWLASPEHRPILLSDRFEETGVAVAVNRESGYTYLTQVFLRRMPP